MHVDRSYDGFFNSIAIATVTCTLLVSIGKCITSYYLLYLIGILALLTLTIALWDYHRYKMKCKGTIAQRDAESAEKVRSPIQIKINSMTKKYSLKGSKKARCKRKNSAYLDIPGIEQPRIRRHSSLNTLQRRSVSSETLHQVSAYNNSAKNHHLSVGYSEVNISANNGLLRRSSLKIVSSSSTRLWKRATNTISAIKRFEMHKSASSLL